MSNIIREIFEEDDVEQVSTSIKETMRSLGNRVFGRFLKFFFLYGRKLHFYFYSFLRSLICYAFQSSATFIRVLSFI